jgi:NADPH:quinone reductase-like Zn-dependent oxidoreductase
MRVTVNASGIDVPAWLLPSEGDVITMRAAIVHEYGDTPSVEEFPEPHATEGQVIVNVTAAGLNPVDPGIVSGGFPFRHPRPPFVVGYSGVGILAGGQRVYLEAPTEPYGAVAELALVDEQEVIPLPEGLDDALAAALGVPGLAAWLALEWCARLAPGETVLVLGAGGGAGQVALQVARILGAGRVVAAARGDASLARARHQGADATAQIVGGQDLRPALREAAPSGYDVIVDLSWGVPVLAAIDTANVGARVVQIGNLAGTSAQLNAGAFRNKLVTIIGHTNLLAPRSERRSAYAKLAQHAREGDVTVDLERVPLDRIADTWARLQAGASRKLVMIP